ncbi:MAG: VTT domain-containing protein [Faecalibacterium sp.]|nr:VTT domain-containing protein [Ruminococcus sp.]MCM1486149.1 VTT domain-containing protein [Faecalibacterium sp.]
MSFKEKIKSIKIISDDPKQKKKQIAIIVAAAVLIVAFIICYCIFGKKLLAFFEDTDKFKDWLDSFGATGKVVFVTIRALQTVVKFIPAEPLEIGSGFAYGTFGGMFYCMLGTFIGSMIIIVLTKIFGVKIVNVFVPQEQINSLRFLQNKSKLSITLFILYLIPGTPKDIITYLIGLTDYGMVKFMILTSIARIPSIITSTICGASLEQKNYALSIGVFVGTALLGLVGLVIYNKLEKKLNARTDSAKLEESSEINAETDNE